MFDWLSGATVVYQLIAVIVIELSATKYADPFLLPFILDGMVMDR